MTMTHSVGNAPKPLTGKRVLVYILAFFGVIFAANGVFLYYALGTFPGVAVESSYKAGQAYNEDIAAAKAQAALGWDVATHVTRASDGTAEITVTALDKNGRAISGLAFSANLQRPATETLDKAVALKEAGAGTYVGNVSDLEAGNWTLTLEGNSGAERVFRSQNRVYLAK